MEKSLKTMKVVVLEGFISNEIHSLFSEQLHRFYTLMPIAMSALGDFAVINRFGGANMKAAKTFHTAMLPNRKPVGTLDIIPWTYTLT